MKRLISDSENKKLDKAYHGHALEDAGHGLDVGGVPPQVRLHVRLSHRRRRRGRSRLAATAASSLREIHLASLLTFTFPIDSAFF